MQESVSINNKETVKEILEAFKNLTTTVVIIKNISKSTNKDKLEEIFTKFGKLIGIYLPVEKDYAFIEFDKRQDANESVSEINNTKLDGLTVKVHLLEPPSNDLIDKYKNRVNKDYDRIYNFKKRSRSRDKDYYKKNSYYNKSPYRNSKRKSNSRE